MRLVAAVVLAIWMSGVFGQPALAEKRIALVIGNSSYQNAALLSNPANDASLLADMFTRATFDVVTLQKDLTATEMRRVLREFADKARDADVAVLYYAGHGIEIDGNNYLVPVDAALNRDADVYDEAIGLDRILVAVEPAKKLRLIILDACRDNPFAKTMKRTIATRNVGQGLAKVEPINPNTMIAFAAKAGFTALDGDRGQTNSPYATALAAHLTIPGLDLRKAFGFVRDDVLKATGNRQEPFIYGSLGGDDIALVSSPSSKPVAADPDAATRRDYEFAERVGTGEAWQSFIATHSDGFYLKLAQAQRNKLAAEEARATATSESAKTAAEEKMRLANEQAKAAEDARIDAEKKADQESIAARKNAVETAKAETTPIITAPADVPDSKPSPDQATAKVAILPPADQAEKTTNPHDTNRDLLSELLRVGCFMGSIDGGWNDAAQRSLARFNRYAGTALDSKVASLTAIDVVHGKRARICPPVCGRGYRIDGDTCTKIACKAGFQPNDDDECERSKSRKPEKAHIRQSDRSAVEPSERPPIRQGNGDILHKCAATSCSMGLRGCMRKAAILGRDNSPCTAKYNACLQTGDFVGRFCSEHGLVRN
jgi:uncharacterized caspase-like protein